MTWYQKIERQPNLVVGVVTAFINMCNLLNITHLSGDQIAGVNVFLAAVFGMITFMVTPVQEVIAQQKPGEAVKATAKAEAAWGLKKDAVVHVNEAA